MIRDDKKLHAIRAAANVVGVSPAGLARLMDSTDPAVRRAARAVTTAPSAARLRAFISRTKADD